MPRRIPEKTNGSPGEIIDAEYAEVPSIEVAVDWHGMPMLEAEQWYMRLRAEFERAGGILNARRCSENEAGYVCFMAGKENACKEGVIRTGRPAGIDSSYRDPKTGLFTPVRICSERCWVLYQGQLIQERKDRELARERAWHEPKE
jgi:hypothetical protein